MIFVIGGTGRLGSALLQRLAELDAPVRALAHSPASRAKIEGFGAEAVDGDLDELDTFEPAMKGCDRVFLLSPAEPNQPEREKAAIDAAARAGVGHVVALSVMGASHNATVGFGRWHADIDDHLAASGLDYTIVQPSGFMGVHLLPVDTIKGQGHWYGMTGDGVSGYIDVLDIASVAATVLTTPGHGGKRYELTGPEAISMPQAAAQLSAIIGRDVTYIDMPAANFRANLTRVGLPDWLADSIVGLYQVIREGHGATVTNTVEEMTGQPARSYREFAEANKEAFRP